MSQISVNLISERGEELIDTMLCLYSNQGNFHKAVKKLLTTQGNQISYLQYKILRSRDYHVFNSYNIIFRKFAASIKLSLNIEETKYFLQKHRVSFDKNIQGKEGINKSIQLFMEYRKNASGKRLKEIARGFVGMYIFFIQQNGRIIEDDLKFTYKYNTKLSLKETHIRSCIPTHHRKNESLLLALASILETIRVGHVYIENSVKNVAYKPTMELYLESNNIPVKFIDSVHEPSYDFKDMIFLLNASTYEEKYTYFFSLPNIRIILI